MRNASGTLIALLNSSRQIVVADLLTIVQQSGTITRLTSASFPLTVVSQYDSTSHLFSPGIPFTRSRTKLVVGLQVDSLTVTLKPDPLVDGLGGVPWPAAVRTGALDEARVILERVFMPSPGDTSPGTMIQFAGRVGQATPRRGSIELEVRSDLELFTALLPRNVYQPGCLHTLFDSGCALSKASFQVSGTAHSGSVAQSIVTGLGQADGYFELGTLWFTSGANVGLPPHTVKSFVSGTATLVVAFPFAPAISDAFLIAPGCDKQQATCTAKFSNLAHFRGYPYVPTPESAF